MRASSVSELAIPQSQFLKLLLMLWLMLQLEWQLVKATAGKPCHTSDVCLIFPVSASATSLTRQLALLSASHLLVLLQVIPVTG